MRAAAVPDELEGTFLAALQPPRVPASVLQIKQNPSPGQNSLLPSSLPCHPTGQRPLFNPPSAEELPTAHSPAPQEWGSLSPTP